MHYKDSNVTVMFFACAANSPLARHSYQPHKTRAQAKAICPLHKTKLNSKTQFARVQYDVIVIM